MSTQVDHNKKKRKKTDPHKRQKAAYSGGLVLEPKKGFYDSHVLLLDFASLYPSIIQEYDLCFTTVDWAPVAKRMEARANGESDAKKARTEDDEVVEEAAEELPPLPDRGDGAKGVLPRVLKNIISKRREVKGLLKKEKNVKKRETYEIRQMALKLTANSLSPPDGGKESGVEEAMAGALSPIRRIYRTRSQTLLFTHQASTVTLRGVLSTPGTCVGDVCDDPW